MRVKFDKNDFPFSKLLQHDQNIKVLLISILILFTYHKTLARGGQRFFCPALYKITKMNYSPVQNTLSEQKKKIVQILTGQKSS